MPDRPQASGSEPPNVLPPAPPAAPAPSLWLFLRVWLKLGLQSFGGGTATMALIHRAVVEEYRWISEAEFTRDWALVQLAPGINLLALTILIGQRVVGVKGIPVALGGLLLPSVTVTVLLTAYYARIQRLAVVQAALHGVIPATVGLGLLTAVQMALPPLAASRKEGRASLALSLFLLVGSGVAGVALHWPVILVLAAAGLIGALAHLRQHKALAETEPPAE